MKQAAIAPPACAEAPGANSLPEYWRLVRRGKGALILFAFLGAAAGVLATLPQTRVYRARASLEIQPLNLDFLNMRQVSPVDQGGGAGFGFNNVSTQVKILESASLVERVFEKLKNNQPAGLEVRTGRIAAWRRALNLPEPTPETAYERALKMAANNLKIRAAGQTRVVEILCDSTDPRIAASFANTLSEEYIREDLEARWSMGRRTGEWLGRQLEDMRIKLERSENSLQDYARGAGLVMTGEKTSLAEENLKQLQDELERARVERIARQSRYEMARSSPPEALPDVLNDASVRENQSKLTDLRRELAEYESVFTPAHYKVQRVQAQIAEIEAALARDRRTILTFIKNEYEEARRREGLLLGEYARQRAQVAGDAARTVQYNILKREVDTNRQLYEAMLQRVREAGIASAMKASNVRVVDPAIPPQTPYKPQVPKSAALGFAAGLACGLGFLVLRERYDRTIQNPEEASFYLGLSGLGVIPSARAGGGFEYFYGRRQKSLAPANGAVVKDRWPALAESFRSTLTSIVFSTRSGKRPTVLVITSAGPSEGKSTVTSNLGVALAEAGQRILVVDADLRKPRLHEMFGAKNDSGLSDFLHDRNAVCEQAARTLVLESGVPGLWLLPAGPATAAATNLLYAKRLSGLFEALRQEFDMVLIDSPPMLEIADARVLGRLADAVVLVVRAGKTTRDAAQAARDRLNEDAIPVLGTVLNDWKPDSGRNGYYYYRSNGYRYGYCYSGRSGS